jgi:hypothetical protein
MMQALTLNKIENKCSQMGHTKKKKVQHISNQKSNNLYLKISIKRDILLYKIQHDYTFTAATTN